MKDINFLKQNNVDVDKCLELFGDIETYNDTIKEFQSGLDEKLSQITKYYNDGDMPNYAIYVHSLKSDCKYFGFTTLANLAYEHEMKSKNNDFEYVKNNYARLMEEAKKVKNIVNEYLEDNTTIETLNEENETLTEDIILVADDSEVIRIFVKKIFDANYQLEFAKNGQEALNIIRDHENDNRIKAILLDLNMPKVSGFSVLDYMTQSNLLEKMPVTIISGDSSSEAINRAFEYPIVDMINKPFSEDKIKDAVEKTIRRASN
ncbi:MAG TPA: response regulator [Candidatus Coprovivens excrementavium]|nr:response regulator [Candidatus Coprovivens excrementavium]